MSTCFAEHYPLHHPHWIACLKGVAMFASLAKETRFPLAIAASLVFALLLQIGVLLGAAAPQRAHAAGETSVDVSYTVTTQDGEGKMVWTGIAPNLSTSSIDPRDELHVEAQLGDAAGNTHYAQATFWLRPENGGADIKVYKGEYGAYAAASINFIDQVTHEYEDGTIEETGAEVGATFPLINAKTGTFVDPGTYRLVLGLRTKQSENDNWGEMQHFVARNTVAVANDGTSKPLATWQALPNAIVGTSYSFQVEAQPSVTGHALRFTEVEKYNDRDTLGYYHLTVSEDGLISGTVANDAAGAVTTPVVKIEELDGSTVVGTTYRTYTLHYIDPPYIDRFSVSLPRNDIGIVPGADAKLHLRLSESSGAQSGKATLRYHDAENAEKTLEATLSLVDGTVKSYEGSFAVPEDAVSIDSVVFDHESFVAHEDKTYTPMDWEKAVAPLFTATIDGELDENTTAPYLSVTKKDIWGDQELEPLWFDGTTARCTSLEAGTYAFSLGAYVNGEPTELSGETEVALAPGVPVAEAFSAGASMQVRPTISAEDDIAYRLNWYADATAEHLVSTSSSRSWKTGSDLYVQATPRSTDLVEYAPSELVKVTEGNAATIALSIAKRQTCTVAGTVSRSVPDATYALSSLNATLTLESADGASRSWSAEVNEDGSYSIAGVPLGVADAAQLVVSGPLTSTAEEQVPLTGVSAGSTVAFDVTVSERQGVIVLRSAVDEAIVSKPDGTVLASKLSQDGRIVYLDNPNDVNTGDQLPIELFEGTSSELYDGGVQAYCSTTTDALNSVKCATVSTQNMHELGSIQVKLDNPGKKLFAAVLIKHTADDKQLVVRADTKTGDGSIGSSANAIAYSAPSVPAGTYQLLFAEHDALMQLTEDERLSPTNIQEALGNRGNNLYCTTSTFEVQEGASVELPQVTLPDCAPFDSPINSEESSMQVTPLGTNLVYRAVIAKGDGDLPLTKDLNLVITTSQEGDSNASIAGSVVYINGQAVTAKETIDPSETTQGNTAYLFPNSIRNSFESSGGNYVISIPYDQLSKYKFDKDNPLTITFTAPRISTGNVEASAYTTFDNLKWNEYKVNWQGFYKELKGSTHYLTQKSTSTTGAQLTCFVPANVSTKTFAIYGTAPADDSASRKIDIYLDGAKVTSATADKKTGRYDAQVTLVNPNEYSKHKIVAQAALDGTTTLKSATMEFTYSPRMAALSTIEVSDYSGDWVTSWKNGHAVKGNWYYLPSVKTKYRVKFKKDAADADKADVSDVYVNVPRGTSTVRLKATYKSNGFWETSAVSMGNTPPSGEWVSYSTQIPSTKLPNNEASRLSGELTAAGLNTSGFKAGGKTTAETAADVNAHSDETAFSLSSDGTTATFEDVEITRTTSSLTAGQITDWVNELPENPFEDGLSEQRKGELYEAGYLPNLTVSTDDSIEDASERIESSTVSYDADSTNIFMRSGAIDSSWTLPGDFSTTGDAGKAATDSISKFPYADGSGYFIYQRTTATRNKLVKIVCDTKTKRLYTTVYATKDTIADTTADVDGDGEAGTIRDKIWAIGDGWNAFMSDLDDLGQGILPTKETSVTGMSTSASTSMDASASADGDRNLVAASRALTTQDSDWAYKSNKPQPKNVSHDEVLEAMARWILKNARTGGDPNEGFSVFCLTGDNGKWSNDVGDKYDWLPNKQTVMSGIDQRVLNYLGARRVKQLEREIEKEVASQVAGGVVGDTVTEIASQVGESAVDIYNTHTSMSEGDAQVEDLYRELAACAHSYNKHYPNTPLDMTGFPIVENLPDPRQHQGDRNKKTKSIEELLAEIEAEEQKDWPTVEDYERNWKKQLAELEANSIKNVANSDSFIPVIDPSGYVYAGVEDNRIEGATATLFEVDGTTGQRTQWDAAEYGQDNPYTTDSEGKYEWFVPEGKWSVTFMKDGYRPYITGENDGIGAAQAGDGTWYMPVAPAQLDVNINLVSTAVPKVESVLWANGAVEVLFTQIMDENSLEGAFDLKESGNQVSIDASFSTVRFNGADESSPLVTKATLTPSQEPVAGASYVLEVSAGAANYAGVKLAASHTALLTPVADAAAVELEETKAAATNASVAATQAMQGVVVSKDGSDVAKGTRWAPQSAFDALNAAIATLNDVLSNENATADELSEAASAMRQAINAFQTACKEGTKASASDGGNNTSDGASSGTSSSTTAVKAGKTYVVGSGVAAAKYRVKTVATSKKKGTVWYMAPKSPKKVKKVAIPATVKIAKRTYRVIGINAKAFAKCKNLTKATIGANVATIGKSAFNGAKKLKTLVIGAKVKTIKAQAFKGCKKLVAVTLKSKLLTKTSCKNLVKGTKITTVRLKAPATKAKKAYKKKFPKRNAGKKLLVK